MFQISILELPPYVKALIRFNGCCKSVGEQTLLVVFRHFPGADDDDRAPLQMGREHDALGLLSREVVDRLEEREDNIIHLVVIIIEEDNFIRWQYLDSLARDLFWSRLQTRGGCILINHAELLHSKEYYYWYLRRSEERRVGKECR